MAIHTPSSLRAERGNLHTIVIASRARQSIRTPVRKKQPVNKHMPTETYLHLLKHIQSNPEASQRQLAKELGVSVGKVNYCLRALIDKGFVKAGNFKRNKDKLSYLYLLTPKGIEEKAKLTTRFLQRKIFEHEQITLEIEQLRHDSLI